MVGGVWNQTINKSNTNYIASRLHDSLHTYVIRWMGFLSQTFSSSIILTTNTTMTTTNIFDQDGTEVVKDSA